MAKNRLNIVSLDGQAVEISALTMEQLERVLKEKELSEMHKDQLTALIRRQQELYASTNRALSADLAGTTARLAQYDAWLSDFAGHEVSPYNLMNTVAINAGHASKAADRILELLQSWQGDSQAEAERRALEDKKFVRFSKRRLGLVAMVLLIFTLIMMLLGGSIIRKVNYNSGFTDGMVFLANRPPVTIELPAADCSAEVASPTSISDWFFQFSGHQRCLDADKTQ